MVISSSSRESIESISMGSAAGAGAVMDWGAEELELQEGAEELVEYM